MFVLTPGNVKRKASVAPLWRRMLAFINESTLRDAATSCIITSVTP